MIESLEKFAPHHQELRQRVTYCIVALVICTALAYLFKESLVRFSLTPLLQANPHLDKLVYTKLTEAFVAYIKISLLAGLILSLPFFFYQSWCFIAPGLTEKEQQQFRRVLFWVSLLFAGGLCFGFFIALPRILAFFMHYTTSTDLSPMLKLGLYLSFIGRLVLTFGLAFEIPFLMVIGVRIGLIQNAYFQQKRLWFYLAIVILSFFLAAGEFIATALLSLPLILLYEMGILANWLFTPRQT